MIASPQEAKVRAWLRCPRAIQQLFAPNATRDPPHNGQNSRTFNLLAGTYTLGSGPAVRWWAALFNATLFAFRDNGWHYCVDQQVLNTIAQVYPNSLLTLRRGDGCGDPWFFLPEYMQQPSERHCPHKPHLYAAEQVESFAQAACPFAEPHDDRRPHTPDQRFWEKMWEWITP